MKTFLEIGSGDFETLDYLTDFGWSGIIIEPIPKYFHNLPKRSNIHYLNIAIDWTDGYRTMYTAPEETVLTTNYTRGMSSFYQRDERLTQEIEVQTRTLESVLDEFDFKTIDFLKVDTEGFDAEIIKMFPFTRYRPTHLKVEKEHLSLEDLSSTISILSENGYHCEWTERDIFGFLVL